MILAIKRRISAIAPVLGTVVVVGQRLNDLGAVGDGARTVRVDILDVHEQRLRHTVRRQRALIGRARSLGALLARHHDETVTAKRELAVDEASASRR